MTTPPPTGTRRFYYTITSLLKEEGTARGVSDRIGMTPQALSYHLKKLKVLDVIRYIGHGTWQVVEEHLPRIAEMGRGPPKVVKINKPTRSGKGGGVSFLQSPRGDDEVAGHGYLWRLKIPRLARWDKRHRRKYLESRGVEHEPIQQGERLVGERLTLGWTVWLTNKSVLGWSPRGKRWLAKSEEEAAAYALYDFMRVVRLVEGALGVSLRINGEHHVRPRREHNAHLKSLLPGAVRARGEKLAVWDDTGTWLKVDDSTGEPELETEASGSGGRVEEIRDASVLVREDYNVLKDEGVTRRFLMEQDARIQEKLLAYAEHIEAHVRVMESISEVLGRLNEWMDEKGMD